MERCPTPTRPVTPSDPASSQKRTSSPGAFTPSTKKHKAEPSRNNSDKDKKRKKRKKKQPITRDVEMSSGLTQKDYSSSQISFPTASSSTQMGSAGSSNPNFVSGDLPPIPLPDRSPPVASPPPLCHDTGQPECRGAPQQVSGLLTLSICLEWRTNYLQSLPDHEALFTSLLSSLVCQICLDLLHKPFALTPCGHVSCYSCLINWFNADRQPDELEGDHVFRKKTCPQCRAVVRGRPIEAWNIKDMVAVVAKSGLALDFPPPAEVDPNEAASGEPADPELPSRDPWANVFPPLPLRTGLSPTGGSPDAFGMFDAEDQVYRCLDCMHEIWGRSCSHCGRHYDGHNVDLSDDEAPPEEHHAIWSIMPAMEHIMGWPRATRVDGSEDGSYEASFIDDERSECGTSEAIEIMSDNSNSVTETTPLTSGQGRDGTANAQVLPSDKCDKVCQTDELQTVKRRSDTRRTRLQVLSDNDENDNETDDKSSPHEKSDEDEGDGSLARPPMRLFGRVRSQQSFSSEVESDSQGSSESDDSDNVGCGDEHVSGVRWVGGRLGDFDEDDEDEEEGDW
ncbi:hypothetical protein H4582DRAFT_2071939 [Lactarius indigo]|nr:hypothetical protein H4582DRAFT_2071939 [Lactarius indigo]